MLSSTSLVWKGSIIKRGTRLISRVGSISIWPPRISHKQPYFTHIRPYHAFASLAHTAGMISACGSIANAWDGLTSKIRILSSFFLSFLSKPLLRSNSILWKAARVSLEQQHCNWYTAVMIRRNWKCNRKSFMIMTTGWWLTRISSGSQTYGFVKRLSHHDQNKQRIQFFSSRIIIVYCW